MQVWNEQDRQGLLAIGKIVAATLDEICSSARPGVATAWLDARAGQILRAFGASSTPAKEFGFPGHLCISVNDEVVHGIPGARALRDGDLLKLDLTADKGGFVADATRMVILPPAGGTASLLADCARRACRAAITLARPGVRLSDLGAAIEAEAERDGFHIVKELCGHGIGRRAHERPEVPNFFDKNNAGILREGMVIAIEPILCSGEAAVYETGDGWTMATVDGGWASHYEETIIVGTGGAEVATVC